MVEAPCVGSTSRSRPRTGKATLTIVMSRRSMKRPKTKTMPTIHLYSRRPIIQLLRTRREVGRRRDGSSVSRVRAFEFVLQGARPPPPPPRGGVVRYYLTAPPPPPTH